MNKQKLLIFVVFFLVVTGTILFLSQNVFGISDCTCSPSYLNPEWACPAGSSYDTIYLRESFCHNGECHWKYEVWCRLWKGGTPTYTKQTLELSSFQYGCCNESGGGLET